MNIQTYRWLLFLLLSFIWGSSFILMKIGLEHLSAYQVAAIRILTAGLVMLPFALKAFKQIPRNKLITVILAGLLGNFLPAFLYCLAETKINSSLASVLNALTPLFTIIIGILFFQLKTTTAKVIGVLAGFSGLVLLPFASNSEINANNYGYSFLVLAATLCYATNVHVVHNYLKQMQPLHIAAVAFVFFIPPCLFILFYTGFLQLQLMQKEVELSILAASVLGMAGTALASVWFYALVKTAGSVFASMVTYAIPFFALIWGLYFGEVITIPEILCLIIILSGVYLVNKKQRVQQ